MIFFCFMRLCAFFDRTIFPGLMRLFFQKYISALNLFIFVCFFVELHFKRNVLIKQFKETLIFLFLGKSTKSVRLKCIPLCFGLPFMFFHFLLIFFHLFESIGRTKCITYFEVWVLVILNFLISLDFDCTDLLSPVFGWFFSIVGV